MKKNNGFSLIEMLVVIGSISLTLPLLFSIIYNLLQQQTKIYRLAEVKRQGDYILNTMENIIKNYAVSIHSSVPLSESNKICQWSTRQNFDGYFLDRFGSYFRFYKSNSIGDCASGSNNCIASFSSILNNGLPETVPLNNNKVLINSFTLTCYQTSPYSPPVVGVSFNISYNTSSNRPEDKAAMTYQTKIKLRSY